MDSLKDMHANHFMLVKLTLLQSFVRVYLAQDKWMLNEKDIPTLKGE